MSLSKVVTKAVEILEIVRYYTLIEGGNTPTQSFKLPDPNLFQTLEIDSAETIEQLRFNCLT
jgi:hypothetical protein